MLTSAVICISLQLWAIENTTPDNPQLNLHIAIQHLPYLQTILVTANSVLNQLTLSGTITSDQQVYNMHYIYKYHSSLTLNQQLLIAENLFPCLEPEIMFNFLRGYVKFFFQGGRGSAKGERILCACVSLTLTLHKRTSLLLCYFIVHKV